MLISNSFGPVAIGSTAGAHVTIGGLGDQKVLMIVDGDLLTFDGTITDVSSTEPFINIEYQVYNDREYPYDSHYVPFPAGIYKLNLSNRFQTVDINTMNNLFTYGNVLERLA